ncbi:hypothetical protein FF38_01285 [Lucilia cuprina]|uniref:Uncharacterized protein n=1 Tax=Lucilia cuprina TaxID=7375 RepID=A0A0L0BUW2_LUCCU|nr:hypothetical protein FF38_01285 [Lucilia cuprina]
MQKLETDVRLVILSNIFSRLKELPEVSKETTLDEKTFGNILNTDECLEHIIAEIIFEYSTYSKSRGQKETLIFGQVYNLIHSKTYGTRITRKMG